MTTARTGPNIINEGPNVSRAQFLPINPATANHHPQKGPYRQECRRAALTIRSDKSTNLRDLSSSLHCTSANKLSLYIRFRVSSDDASVTPWLLAPCRPEYPTRQARITANKAAVVAIVRQATNNDRMPSTSQPATSHPKQVLRLVLVAKRPSGHRKLAIIVQSPRP